MAAREDDLAYFEVFGGRGELVLNRPARRNAVNGPMVEAMIDSLAALVADPAVGVIVLRGEGGALCSGLDIKEFGADPRPRWVEGFQGRWTDLHVALLECPKVIVVALERFGINAGSSLTLAGDLVVAGETAFLQIGEVRQSGPAPMNLAWLALRTTPAVANRLLITGRRVPGPELESLGLAAEVVPDAQVLERSRALADELVGYPDDGPARAKATVRGMFSPGLEARAHFEAARTVAGSTAGWVPTANP
ncbi:MAG TPA: enoyl-CoA hydratase/isomerase family protein [Acidimicrobiales bacterium]|nr:enoyl-CoA hydratase/isomerase family protein [Acidimicrobiales bacterium]